MSRYISIQHNRVWYAEKPHSLHKNHLHLSDRFSVGRVLRTNRGTILLCRDWRGGVILRIFYDYTFLWHYFYYCQNKNKNTINLWKYCDTLYTVHLWGDAEKSLARPTSWCRRTESILSLEKGVCSCAELQVFSCYRGWKEACQEMRAISTTWRRELSSSFFFFPTRQGAEVNSRHSDTNIRGTRTIVCHRT